MILGAGLTGLSVAYHLEQNGFYDFKIFEKENTSGGLLRSFYPNGFTFDFTGHLLHINNDYFRNFLNKIAGIQNFDLVYRNSCIHFDNKLIPYPFQMNLGNLAEEQIIDSVYGFINRKKHIRKPKSFYEWVLKYFGSGIGKHFFFPYNQKLLSYDTKKITASWTGRFVPQTNLKTILSCALNKTTNGHIGYNSSFYYPKKEGIYYLIKQLEKNIKSKINTNYKAINIDLKNKVILFENGHKEKFKKLITTMPLDLLLKTITESSSTNLSKCADNLLCNSVLNFNLGFDVKNLTNKHWMYFPQKNTPFYRVGFWHNINKNSAPKNNSAIYGEFSYLSNKTSNKKITNITEKSINKTLEVLKLTNSNINTKKILNLPHAYVIYNFWREKNLTKLLKKLNDLSIYSIGRYGEWKYSSMQEAVLDGKKCAESILKKENLQLKTPKGRFESNEASI